MGMCPKQRAGLRQHLLLYTPANLLAIETLLQFKQVDCKFSLTNIRASPANRMTRAVLSILVMFVCLAPMLEVNSTTDDFKMVIEGVELYINSLKGDLKKKKEAMELRFNSLKDYYNTEKDALAERIREQNRLHATLAKLEQYSGPEFAAIKKILETLKESNSELNAKFLLMTEVSDHKFQIIQKKIEGIKDLVHETEVNKDEL
ncbi:uncharacterized protein LOC132475619 isoform X2 [Gadus macrocephalus]|uniref:uncharacterized protein LOC132475619 isoform X2 n=1 Tax=Gadus macrocephalus TaxID=80720 RepID=UPI0028CBB6C1|nr:uncharacterized protein LOC132475619 isoform X2 [Gadus macrocephalus]